MLSHPAWDCTDFRDDVGAKSVEHLPFPTKCGLAPTGSLASASKSGAKEPLPQASCNEYVYLPLDGYHTHLRKVGAKKTLKK
jgi:hypothetical protein